MCTVINNVKTSRRNSYTCLHPFTYWRQMRKSHSDAIEIPFKKLVSLASIRLRGTEMAANRKRRFLLWRHDNTANAPFSFLATFRFQDGDAVDLGKLRGTAFSRLLLSFNVCTLRVGMLLSCKRIGLPCYYGTAACATFAYFLCTMHVICVAYSTD